MKHAGCPVGSRRYGNKCIRPELPMIGTYLVPSVENRAGCKYVKGKWVSPGVCLLQDPLDTPGEYGLTAPIKGMYIWWGTDEINDKGTKGPGEYRYYINGSLMADSPGFPIVLGGGVPVIEYEGVVEDADSAEQVRDGTRIDVLEMAKNIMDGETIDEWGEGLYFKPDGAPTKHHDREAVYAPGMGDLVRNCYENVERKPSDAFSFRAKGAKKVVRGRAPRRTFEIDPKGPPTEYWLPHKPKVKEGWEHGGGGWLPNKSRIKWK
jgi:hypothetical protein